MTPVEKRARRANMKQEKHAPCIICGANFDDCPHSRVEIDNVILAIQIKQTTERYL
jgi:hypothetical protein